MHVLQCTNGHFFDGDKYSTCPHCGAASGLAEPKKKEKSDSIFKRNKPKTVSQTGKTMGMFSSSKSTNPLAQDRTMMLQPEDKTEMIMPLAASPVQNSAPVNPPQPEAADVFTPPVQEPVPVMQPVKPQPAQQVQPVFQTPQQQNIQPQITQPKPADEPVSSESGKTLGFFRSNIGVEKEPVVGWLVCVKGKHFGEAFELYAGRNSIGRDSSNKVVIAGDNTVSASKHLWVTYEPKKREFYVQPGESSGLSYLNGDNIMTPQAINMYDKLEMGSGLYLLIPLCCDSFTWEDYTNNQ